MVAGEEGGQLFFFLTWCSHGFIAHAPVDSYSHAHTCNTNWTQWLRTKNTRSCEEYVVVGILEELERKDLGVDLIKIHCKDI